MSTCPFHQDNSAAPEVPDRISKLPMLRGFHVPWFVAKVNGEFDFRIMDHRKLVQATRERLCWVCGEKLGRFKSFVIGPMCAVNRTNAEPPSHRECAEYSAKHCPFLSRPNMKRREDEVTAEGESAGMAIKRNPGCCAVWTVTDYTVFSDRKGGVLFDIGEPVDVDWFAEGRAATRAEVVASLDSGLPILEAACETEDTPQRQTEAKMQLALMCARLEPMLPREEASEPEPSDADEAAERGDREFKIRQEDEA